jgi:hypothetical protein
MKEERPRGRPPTSWRPSQTAEDYYEEPTLPAFPSHETYMRLLARKIRELERKERAS